MGANGNINDLELAKFIELAGEFGLRVHILHGDNWCPAVANLAALPGSGNTLGDVRQALDTGIPYRWDGSAWTVWIAGGGGGTWGSITGTLSSQTDLQTVLNAKMGSGAYVLTSRDSALTNQVNLGSLTTGILKQTVAAGVSTFTIVTDNSGNWNTAYTHSQIVTGNPHGTTKADLGLGSVDNTSDVNKPVSTAQQTAINLKANLASPTFTGTVAGITKAMVGLGNVDNTSDATKNSATANITNKTMTGDTNTLTASVLKSSTTEINVSSATAPLNGQVLTAISSTAATWQTPSGGGGFTTSFGAKKSATQTIINGTETLVQFDSELWDTNGDYNNTTYRFIAPSSGKYQLNCITDMPFGHGTYVRVNGTYIYAVGVLSGSSSANTPCNNISVVLSLNLSDYVEIYVYQISGSSKLLNSGISSHFSMYRVQ